METIKMVNSKYFLFAFILLGFPSMAQNITNVTAIQEQNNIIVSYQLVSKEPCKINLYVSQGNGEWKGPLINVKGNVGQNTKAGVNSIVWDVLSEYSELKGNNISFKVESASQQLKVGDKYQGGVIFFIENGHGLIAFPYDFQNLNWYDAKKTCENLSKDFKDDWYLPSKKELNILLENKNIIGGFNENFYWTSTENKDGLAWLLSFKDEFQDYVIKEQIYHVRPIRTF